MAERARKLLFHAAVLNRRVLYAPSGTHVGLDEALRTGRDILEGRLDDIPVEAFYFAGGIEEIRMS